MPFESPCLPALLLACLLLFGAGTQAAEPAGNRALEPVLAGEFALQAGRLDDAARAYLEAARRTGDVALAERATRIALLANEDRIAADALTLWRRAGQPSLALLAAETTVNLRAGRASRAFSGAEKLLRDEDPNGWRLALFALSSGGKDNRPAASVLRRLRERGLLDAKEPSTMLAWAGLAQRLQDQALMDALVADAARAFPGDARVQLLQAALARESGNLEGARSQLDALRDRLDELPGMRMALAGEYEALGDPAAAAAVLARGAQNLQSRALRAAMLSQAKDDAGLAALYEELERESNEASPQQRLLLGQVAESLKRHAEALGWYATIAEGELHTLASLRSATTLHAMGRQAEAFERLRALQDGGEADEDVRRDAYLAEAELRREDGDREGEFDAYARGLAAIPDDLAILYSRALAWERIDDIPRAEADLRKLLVIEPDNVAALNALGYTLADRTTRYREALELIDRARVADPGSAAIIDSHGWVLYRLGRHEEALVQLRRAFALMRDAEVAAHIAEVLWNMGRRDEARRWFDTARSIDPEHRALKRALEATGA